MASPFFGGIRATTRVLALGGSQVHYPSAPPLLTSPPLVPPSASLPRHMRGKNAHPVYGARYDDKSQNNSNNGSHRHQHLHRRGQAGKRSGDGSNFDPRPSAGNGNPASSGAAGDYVFSGMEIIFLGTSSASPSARRNTSCIAARLNGTSFLFDAGEGASQRVRQSRMSLGGIDAIFVTHLHLDHVVGIPGIILSNNRVNAPATALAGANAVDLYAPSYLKDIDEDPLCHDYYHNHAPIPEGALERLNDIGGNENGNGSKNNSKKGSSNNNNNNNRSNNSSGIRSVTAGTFAENAEGGYLPSELVIYGPPGIRDFVDGVMRVTRAETRCSYHVIELATEEEALHMPTADQNGANSWVGGNNNSDNSNANGNNTKRNTNGTKNHPQSNNKTNKNSSNISKSNDGDDKTASNAGGVDGVPMRTSAPPRYLLPRRSPIDGVSEWVVRATPQHTVVARRISHTVTCLGYVLFERDRRGGINTDVLDKYGIPTQGKHLRSLFTEGGISYVDKKSPPPSPARSSSSKSSSSKSSTTDSDCSVNNGQQSQQSQGQAQERQGEYTKWLPVEEVTSEPVRGRKVVILGDTNDASSMAGIAKGADLVVHEATFVDEEFSLARRRGHATPSAAVRFAHAAKAKLLALTHFSCRYSEAEIEKRILKSAVNTTRKLRANMGVFAACDLAEVRIPNPAPKRKLKK